MTLLIICLLILIIGLSIFFYFLHLRLEVLALRVSRILKDMDTLYVNQQTLESDIKKIFTELQNVQKEIHRIIRK